MPLVAVMAVVMAVVMVVVVHDMEDEGAAEVMVGEVVVILGMHILQV